MPRVIQTQGIRSVVDVGALGAFQQALSMFEPQDLFNELGTTISTNRAEARIPFLWYPPRTREWVGERQRGSLDGGMHIIPVRTWESTVAVPRTAVEDDMVGLIEQRVRDLAAEYVRFQHEQFINVLANGTALNTFDGQPLLTNNPAVRGANNVNLTTAELNMSALQNAIAAMGLFTDPDNRPIGLRPTHLLVGPRLEFTARQLTESQTIVVAGTSNREVGSANTLYNTVQVVVSPYINDNDWYLIAAGSNAHRPVIRVERSDVPLEFTARTSPDHESVYSYDSYEYGYRARLGFGAGAWYAVYASQT
jgi:phage major head subunit gpT-like protein